MTIEEIIPKSNVFLKLFVSWDEMTDGKMTNAEMSRVPIVRTPITIKNAPIIK